ERAADGGACAISLLRGLRDDGVDIARRQPRGAKERAVFEWKVATIKAARHTAECERSEARSLDAENRRQDRSGQATKCWRLHAGLRGVDKGQAHAVHQNLIA